MHYWADSQSVHGFRCYDSIDRTRNVSEWLYSLYACFQFSLFPCILKHKVLRGWKRWVINPLRNCHLETEDARRWSGRLFEMTRGGIVETSFAEFHCCCRHGHVPTVPARPERSTVGMHADVLEICGTGTSDTAKCKECNFKLYSPRQRQPV